MTSKPDEMHEFVIDSAISGQNGEDRLGHEVIADELARLALFAPTPANIALFGPWGSGKTGIGNLLKSRVEGQRVRFVRVDAFKHAEVPLRREFLNAVAPTLGKAAQREAAKLYATEQTNRVTLPGREVAKGLGLFLGLLATVAALGALYALLPGGHFFIQWRDYLSTAIPAVLAPAIVVALIGATLGKSLTVQSTRAAPSANDEFEEIFRRMVLSADIERLIVFVDELDRCSSDEVASTLDAVRTFLGVPGCVFVISADQLVLETALANGLRQETPTNTTDPYHASGSGYLDKLFQFQVHVPPAPLRRLTRYAMDLLTDRPGLWGTVDLERIVSILIPTHVTSPRRVKTLLNSFALAYRTTRTRLSAEEGLATRASEIAKWSTLRVEFPLFAQEATRDSRLIAATTATAAGEPIPPSTPPNIQKRAREYISGAAPVDTVLANDDGVPLPPPPTDIPAINKAQAGQLSDYLLRTRSVTGPGTDIIQLEGSGDAFGLPSSLAQTLERSAVDGASIRTVNAIRRSPDQAGPALSLLTELLREASIGVEAENVASSALALVDAFPGLSTVENANLVEDRIHNIRFDGPNDATRRGAYRLANSLSSAQSALLRLAFASSDPEPIADLMLEQSSAAVRSNTLWQQAVASIILDYPPNELEFWNTEEPNQVSVLNAIRQTIADLVVRPDEDAEHFKALADDEQESAIGTARDRRDALDRLIKASADSPEVEAALISASIIGQPKISDAARGALEERSGKIPDYLVNDLLRIMRTTMWPPVWEKWLPLVEPEQVSVRELTLLQNQLLNDGTRFDREGAADELEGSLTELVRIAKDRPLARLLPQFLVLLSNPVSARAGQPARPKSAIELSGFPRIVSAMLDAEAITQEEAATMMMAVMDHVVRDEDLAPHVEAIKMLTKERVLSLAPADKIRLLITRLEPASRWPEPGFRAVSLLKLTAALAADSQPGKLQCPVSHAQLVQVLGSSSRYRVEVAALWLGNCALLATPTEASEILRLADSIGADPIFTSIDVMIEAAPRGWLKEVISDIALSPSARSVNPRVVRALANPLRPSELAQMVIQSVSANSGVPARVRAIDTWVSFDVVNREANEKIVREFWLPAAAQNVEGAIAMSKRLTPIRFAKTATRNKAIDTIISTMRASTQANSVYERLQKAGYMTRKRRGLLRIPSYERTRSDD